MNSVRIILHPTDFSDLSRSVLKTALDEAKAQGAQLILLNVREPQEVIEGEFGMIMPEAEPSDEAIVAQMRDLLPANCSVKTELLIAHGNAAEEIVRVAKSNGCDVIMMATHGHEGFLSRLFHANIVAHVERDAPCPVIAIGRTTAETAQVASSF